MMIFTGFSCYVRQLRCRFTITISWGVSTVKQQFEPKSPGPQSVNLFSKLFWLLEMLRQSIIQNYKVTLFLFDLHPFWSLTALTETHIYCNPVPPPIFKSPTFAAVHRRDFQRYNSHSLLPPPPYSIIVKALY